MGPRFLDGSKISGWIQDFWTRVFRNLGSWIHGSKISGQEFSESWVLDLGSMDPRFLDKSFLKSWILDLGSMDPRFLDKSCLKSWILGLGSVDELLRLENLKSETPSLNLSK